MALSLSVQAREPDQCTPSIRQNEVKAKISATSGKGANQDRKVALRAELDSLRAEQAKIKGGRGKTLDQVKTLQDNLAKKVSPSPQEPQSGTGAEPELTPIWVDCATDQGRSGGQGQATVQDRRRGRRSDQVSRTRCHITQGSFADLM